jgi:formylglycine-generating enzyme required for sulfatase activity
MFPLLAGWLSAITPSNALSKDLAAIRPAEVPVPVEAVSRHALVVSAARYSAGELANVRHDALAMARKLATIGFQVKMLEDASSGDLDRALGVLGDRAADGDLVFFYFAGHTATVRDGLMLLPIDAKVGEDGDPVPGAIGMDRVLRSLGRVQNEAPKIVVLDTAPYPVKSRYRGIRTGSPPVTAPRGFFIAQSNGFAPSEQAGSELSAYTQALLNLIGTPDRRIEEVFEMVRVAVRETANPAGVPSYNSSLADDVYLVPPGGSGPVDAASEPDRDAHLLSRGVRVQTPPDAPHARLDDRPPSGGETAQASGRSEFEGTLWNVIKESSNPADFEAYLEVFPNGQYAKEAKQRISILRAPQTAKPSPGAPEIEPLQAEFDVVVAANLRESPSLAASILRTAPKGERLRVTGRVAGQNWYQVRLSNGATAYVSSNLLRERPTAAPKAALESKAAPKTAVLPPRDAAPPTGPSGRELRDCPECPVMVRVPAGSFRMGTDKGDLSEQPAHTVQISQNFTIGKYEVTIAEWKACAAAKGCTYNPDLKDAPETAPMHKLSWRDVQEYLGWLRKVTGQPYRLPSEAEWEYAARGGSERKYWWGDRMAAGMADCKDCGGGWSFKAPAAVTASKANSFGLHGTSGGVWEWTGDCWNADYGSAPRDGSASKDGDCTARVLRGGSWRNDANSAHSASRLRYDFDVRYSTNGFRVARDLH